MTSLVCPNLFSFRLFLCLLGLLCAPVSSSSFSCCPTSYLFVMSALAGSNNPLIRLRCKLACPSHLNRFMLRPKLKQPALDSDIDSDDDSEENQPLLKKIKPDHEDQVKEVKSPKVEIKEDVENVDDDDEDDEDDDDDNDEEEKVEVDEIVHPDLILQDVIPSDEIMEDGNEETLETVIEEPVNLLEEDDNSISEPPLRSCSVDHEIAEVLSVSTGTRSI